VKVELNERELLVVRCVLGIEGKNLEIEKYQLEMRIDSLSKFKSIDIEDEKKRLGIIEERLPEIHTLERKFQEVLESVRS